jgi:hypothetical protein
MKQSQTFMGVILLLSAIVGTLIVKRVDGGAAVEVTSRPRIMSPRLPGHADATTLPFLTHDEAMQVYRRFIGGNGDNTTTNRNGTRSRVSGGSGKQKRTDQTPTQSPSPQTESASPSVNAFNGQTEFEFASSYADAMISEKAHVTLIYYGCNSSVGQPFYDHTSLLGRFINDLGTNSYWWLMVREYYNPNVRYTPPYTALNGAVVGYVSEFELYSTVMMCDYKFGMDITDTIIQQKIASHAIYVRGSSGARSDIFVIIPDANVNIDGACTEFCGYHYAWGSRQTEYNIAVIVNPFSCPTFHMCASTLLSENGDGSINGNVEVDAQVNIIAHEIAEIVTDPYDGSGWISISPDVGLEICDFCAWNFRHVIESNGNYWNEDMGDGYYLIQAVVPRFCPSVECESGLGNCAYCSSSFDFLSDEGCLCYLDPFYC